MAEINTENNNTNESVNKEMHGLNYMTKLSYAIIDRSTLDYQEKRNLLLTLHHVYTL